MAKNAMMRISLLSSGRWIATRQSFLFTDGVTVKLCVPLVTLFRLLSGLVVQVRGQAKLWKECLRPHKKNAVDDDDYDRKMWNLYTAMEEGFQHVSATLCSRPSWSL